MTGAARPALLSVALGALLCGACSSMGCTREASSPPLGVVPDARVASARFPVRLAEDGRWLVDANGKPFLIAGEAAWSLLVRLTREDARRYLDDRAARGINVLLVNLIEHRFSDDPPRNRAGDAPFLAPGDFSRPNQAYFAHADEVLIDARARGMLVLLFPAYLGYGGGEEGWFKEMSAAPPGACRSYGEWLGNRYRDMQNIVWVAGGDYSAPAGSDGERCMLEIMVGLANTDPDNLRSGHWVRETTSLSQAAFRAQMNLDGVYTGKQVHVACRDARAAAKLPTFLMEGLYENEHQVTETQVRQQAYESLLGCGAGTVTGNRPIWLFDPGWQNALGSPGSRAIEHLGRLVAHSRWFDLEPDDPPRRLVVKGGGTFGDDDWVSAGLSADGKLAMIYVPAEGSRMLTLDLGVLAGTLDATWIDPRDGSTTPAAGSPWAAAAALEVTVPGGKPGDWVLLLESR